jgi:hypothetical protein
MPYKKARNFSFSLNINRVNKPGRLRHTVHVGPMGRNELHTELQSEGVK